MNEWMDVVVSPAGPAGRSRCLSSVSWIEHWVQSTAGPGIIYHPVTCLRYTGRLPQMPALLSPSSL